MPEPKRYRVGLVGAGHISEFHIRALKRVAGVELVGVTDLDAERAKNLATRFSAGKVFADLAEMGKAGLDVVHVMTPPSSHAELTLQALDLGCHVLVEKPLATSVEDCDRIITKAKQVNRVVGVDHAMLYDPFIKRALDLVQRGTIGDVVSADYFRSLAYPGWREGPPPVHYRQGGYPFRDLGVHALYVLEAFLGAPKEVTAHYQQGGSDPNLHFSEWRVLVQTAKGTGQIHLSGSVRPLVNCLVLHGTRGSIRADLFGLSVTCRKMRPMPEFVRRAVNSGLEATSQLFQVPWNAAKTVLGFIRRYHGVQELIRAFYADLKADQPFPVTAEAARRSVFWTEEVARPADAAKDAFLARYAAKPTAPVLLTGGAGFIGKVVLKRLLDRGERVRLLVRRPPGGELEKDPRIDLVLGDMGDPAVVDRATDGVRQVYHLGAAVRGSADDFYRGTVAGTRNVVSACTKFGVEKLVYVSSLSVLSAATMKPDSVVKEDWPYEPTPGRRGQYTITKLEAERVVRKAVDQEKLPAVILRPGLVFGPGNNLLGPSVGIRMGGRLIVLGDGRVVLPLVYVEDLADAIAGCIEKPVFDGSIFHLVDDARVTQNEVIRQYRETTGKKIGVWYFPLMLLYPAAFGVQTLASVLGRGAPLSIYRVRSARACPIFDCHAARERLGWVPARGVERGLRETLATM